MKTQDNNNIFEMKLKTKIHRDSIHRVINKVAPFFNLDNISECITEKELSYFENGDIILVYRKHDDLSFKDVIKVIYNNTTSKNLKVTSLENDLVYDLPYGNIINSNKLYYI